MLIMQSTTGTSRPGEMDAKPAWKPLNDMNGVSGHAFIGAIPFLSAAQMTDNRLARATLYLASAVDRSIKDTSGNYSYQLQPIPLADGAGIGLLVRR